MSEASYKFNRSGRTIMERLFEPPVVGKMSPAASVVAHALLFVWSLFVLFPIYWVLITSYPVLIHSATLVALGDWSSLTLPAGIVARSLTPSQTIR